MSNRLNTSPGPQEGQQHDLVTPEANLSLSPSEIKGLLRAWHASNDDTYDTRYEERDAFITWLLFGQSIIGAAPDIAADFAAQHRSESTFLPEKAGYWTPYSAFRAVLRRLQLGPNDIFCDLGAGYGTLAVYGATVVPEAQFRGYELMPHRVEAANRAISRLELPNAQMIQADAKDADFSDGTVFYLFLPFSTFTDRAVFTKLGEIAETKPIRVIMRHMGGAGGFNRGWLGSARITWLNNHDSIAVVEAGPS